MDNEKLSGYNDSKRKEAQREKVQYIADVIIATGFSPELRLELKDTIEKRIALATDIKEIPLHADYDEMRERRMELMKKHNKYLEKLLNLDHEW